MLNPRKYRKTGNLKKVEQPTRTGDAPMEPGLFKRVLNPGAQADYQEQKLRHEADVAAFNKADADYQRYKARLGHLAEENDRYQQRRVSMAGMPKFVRRNPLAQVIGDQAVDLQRGARQAMDDVRALPVVPTVGVLGGVAGLGLAGTGAYAYGELVNEGMPTDAFSVGGRIATNAAGVVTGGLGTDPLADARRNIQEAEKILGSRAVVDAILDQEVAAEPRFGNTYSFEEEVEAKAMALMQQGHMSSDGQFVPMKPNQAYDIAYRIVSQDYSINQNPDY